ncbi:MAG: ABC transporter permease [Candidatus Babeliaceae bacterium]|nr:ABC transporter permease [Candidatus Babeliaceae bacterium]
MKKRNYFMTCKNLIWSDLTVYRQTIIDKIIDVGIWAGLTVLVTGYVMPYFGLVNFGPFQFGGIIAAVGLFEMYASVVDFVSDLEGDRAINYNLTLPIPSALALMSKSAYYFLVYASLTFAMLPIGYLCVWGQLPLMQVSYGKLILAIFFQCMFYACFILWASSMINNMAHLGRVWNRCIFPMWLMGGFQFSWLALYSVLPALAYINAINPMIYITESTRVALLGQTGYADFWLCLVAIAGFSAICFAMGVRNLKKRLDFV